MKAEQISFLEPIEKSLEKETHDYDATICKRCCCNKCRKSEEIYPTINEEEYKKIKEPCFNCDECFYYGMDNKALSKDKVKFKCDKFEMSNHYAEIRARKERKKFKTIKND